MKKIILLFLIASLVSCGGNNTSSPKNPEDDNFTLEGTVVKVFNLLMPRAEAADTNFAILLGNPEEAASLPASVIGKNCPATRCAFLLDTGVRQGDRDSGISIKLIAITPIVDGKFVFAMNKGSNPLYESGGNSGENPLFNSRSVVKVVVRGWDPVTKKPLAKSSQDREIVLGPDDIKQHVASPQSAHVSIAVTPESTVQARRRVEVLKSNLVENEGSFFQIIKDLFGEPTESLRDIALRCVQSLMGPESDEKVLLDFLQKTAPEMTHSDAFKPQGILISLKIKYANTPISSMSVSNLLLELNMLNVQIQAARMGQINQIGRYPTEKLVYDQMVVHEKILELKTLKIALDGANKESGYFSQASLAIAAEIKTKSDLLVPIAHELEDLCRSHSIYVKLEAVSQELQSMKMSVNSSDQKFIQVRSQIEAKQIPIIIEGLFSVDQLRSIDMACVEVQDFNSTRSNKDK